MRVSILVLLEPPLIHRYVERYFMPTLFQSLFYWNLLSYFIAAHKEEKTASFNPCFTGTSSHTKATFFLPNFFSFVSILVLLEPPLILGLYGSNLTGNAVSILVLLEPPLIPYFYP